MISDRDKDMINAMSVIKEYCRSINDTNKLNECLKCPMYDNCLSIYENKRFPLYWYIPEV